MLHSETHVKAQNPKTIHDGGLPPGFKPVLNLFRTATEAPHD